MLLFIKTTKLFKVKAWRRVSEIQHFSNNLESHTLNNEHTLLCKIYNIFSNSNLPRWNLLRIYIQFIEVLLNTFNYINSSSSFFVSLNAGFNVRTSDFCRLFKVKHVMYALIKTSIEFTEKSSQTLQGIEPGPFRTRVVCFYHLTEALGLYFKKLGCFYK